jgi:hypothetical protein
VRSAAASSSWSRTTSGAAVRARRRPGDHRAARQVGHAGGELAGVRAAARVLRRRDRRPPGTLRPLRLPEHPPAVRRSLHGTSRGGAPAGAGAACFPRRIFGGSEAPRAICLGTPRRGRWAFCSCPTRSRGVAARGCPVAPIDSRTTAARPRLLPSKRSRALSDSRRACCSSISKVWISTIETLVHAAFRWSPRRRRPIAAPLVTESRGRSGTRCRDVVMPGRRATPRPSPRRGRGVGRTGRGRPALWRVAGCRSSVRRS